MRYFLCLCLCLSWMTTLAFATEPLRIAVDVPYPPFAYLDEKGELTGFDVDIARALCAEINRTCVFVTLPFDSILPAIAAGDAELSVAGMGDTPERRKLVDFSNRYFNSHSIYVEKAGTVSGVTPTELKGKRIGVQPTTLQEQFAKETFKESVIVTHPTVEALFEELKKGTIDVTIVDGLPAYDYLKSPAGESLETVGPPITEGILVIGSSIAVSKKLPELTKALNNAIQALRSNGEYAKINRKYFDFNVF